MARFSDFRKHELPDKFAKDLAKAIDVVFTQNIPTKYTKAPPFFLHSMKNAVMRALLVRALEHKSGNVLQTAKTLGIARETIRRYIKVWDIQEHEYKKTSEACSASPAISQPHLEKSA